MGSPLEAATSTANRTTRTAGAPHRRVARSSSVIGALAARSLRAEARLYPKPGLVSPMDPGSHTDMDIRTFLRSARSLRGYFAAIAEAGRRGAGFPLLQRLGIRAEARMLTATGGVNTHRGAIFTLGLLCAAGGWCVARKRRRQGRCLGEVVGAQWGAAVAAAVPGVPTHGSRVLASYGAGGARREAALGFPTLYEVGLPEFQRALRAGADSRPARVQALFSLMAVVEDTNLLHRGGRAGLALVQGRAGEFLSAGGVFRPDWEAQAVAVHQELVRHHLSPGGSADLLAATLLVHALGGGDP
jgi:triphosphoribosyl-dephospho-CoA synthase